MSANRGNLRPWMTSELKILRAVYPLGGVEAVQKRLPHRSAKGIRFKAAEINVRRVPDKSLWPGYRHVSYVLPIEVINALRYSREKTWPGMSLRAIARELGVNLSSVQFHVRKGRESWAEDEAA